MELAVSAAALGVEVTELGAGSAAVADESAALDGVELGVGAVDAGDSLAERLDAGARVALRDVAFTALPSSAAGFDAGGVLRLGTGAAEVPASATATGLSRAASDVATGAGVDSLAAVVVGSVTFACGALISASLRL
jgi:hypothetical protein